MKRLLLMVMVVGLLACEREEPEKVGPTFGSQAPESTKEYVFAIHPLHNPVRLFEIYEPLFDLLNRSIPNVKFRLEASRNYDEFDKKLYSRQFDFALPNPYQTIKAISHGYHVIAKMGDDQKFTGIILVRRDSGIRQVSELKGKKVAYPARTALAAALMPQYYLHTHGLNVNQDIENKFVGSQESSIMNVYLGDVAAAATWLLPWESFQQEHPELARELTVQWQTDALINNSVMARDDVPTSIATEVAQFLATLHTTEEGRAILARMPLSRFELADDLRYRVVEKFLTKFRKQVRQLD